MTTEAAPHTINIGTQRTAEGARQIVSPPLHLRVGQPAAVQLRRGDARREGAQAGGRVMLHVVAIICYTWTGACGVAAALFLLALLTGELRRPVKAVSAETANAIVYGTDHARNDVSDRHGEAA